MATLNKNRPALEWEKKEGISALVKDVDVKTGVITGYFAAFGNVDAGRDMIIPGAFTKTIAERGPAGSNQIKHIKQHNQDFPLGQIQTLKEDVFGLYFETKATLGIQYVEDVLRLYEAGVYKEHSIGYKTIKYTFVQNPNDENDFHWELNELKLWEGSTVLWGMNDNTPFRGFKSESVIDQLKEIDEEADKIFSALRIKSLSDETYSSLEVRHAKLKSLYRSMIETLQKQEPSPANTPRAEEPKSEIDMEEAKNQMFNQIKKLL
jgi:HK97 family phage prohead protease